MIKFVEDSVFWCRKIKIIPSLNADSIHFRLCTKILRFSFYELWISFIFRYISVQYSGYNIYSLMKGSSSFNFQLQRKSMYFSINSAPQLMSSIFSESHYTSFYSRIQYWTNIQKIISHCFTESVDNFL